MAEKPLAGPGRPIGGERDSEEAKAHRHDRPNVGGQCQDAQCRHQGSEEQTAQRDVSLTMDGKRRREDRDRLGHHIADNRENGTDQIAAGPTQERRVLRLVTGEDHQTGARHDRQADGRQAAKCVSDAVCRHSALLSAWLGFERDARSVQIDRRAAFSNARRTLGQYSRDISSQPRRPGRVIRLSGSRARRARRRGSIRGDATRE